ncbi:MAG TPA: hypothetical protein VL490_10700 [Mucilaginibacter sp.]|jgi:hypothetical protein|nr:hypothetical protein [Mucilaginibacter sp.]
MAAEAFVLFLDEKNQKSSQPKCFFAARGLCPAPKEPLWGKAGKTTGYGLLRLRANPNSAKFLMPLPSHKAINFTCFHPKLFG